MYAPKSLLLQWHITDRCNLRCAHCYQESYSRKHELNFLTLLTILKQFHGLLAHLNQRVGQKIWAHVTVTGGEPFVRSDFLDLLEELAANYRLYTFAILTNGTLIDATLAKRLRELSPAFVQVSIEGTETTHNNIRGADNFNQTIKAIRYLRQEKVRTFIAFTAHRANFHEFPEVAQLGRQLKVNRVWADRLIPCGRGTHLQTLQPEETQTFFQIMAKSRQDVENSWFNRTEISMQRALQFLVAGGYPYRCTAGQSLLAIQPNGDLYPCRRLPIRVGNVLETPLTELYDNADLFQSLRKQTPTSPACQTCCYTQLCSGGLKCLSYALTGNPFQQDPGCWKDCCKDK